MTEREESTFSKWNWKIMSLWLTLRILARTARLMIQHLEGCQDTLVTISSHKLGFTVKWKKPCSTALLVTPATWWVGKNKTFVFINIFFCDSWVGNHRFKTQSQSYFASNIVFFLSLYCWFCSLYRGVWHSAAIAKGPDALPQGVLHSMHELIGEGIKRKKKKKESDFREKGAKKGVYHIAR